MGKFSRSKGVRNEQRLVNLMKKHGIRAERIPLSGASGRFRCDILMLGEFQVEAKVRAEGFKTIYKWKGDNDALIISADRAAPLLVVTLETMGQMLAQEYQAGVAGEEREYISGVDDDN